ncbi:flagellar hook assembly protein FlgD [Roseomonas genomospecies 6]|uniref:Basal-body rod modification protein FlgD n=1 Tax=Roseomonas genomospecies 6 TaxID=214106 RepID=A0A9W7NNJ2_9PROT|nr:flagellar hook assembly protein FlgD [Roseomonas genomospecies 6]KAA0683614.1 flagellar hook assembly protein FlgD [Roseomonas genomospecies 6]
MATTNTDYGSSWNLNQTKTKTDTTAKTTKTADEQKLDTAVKGLGDNFEHFLKLLTTQMQNQDPLKPMDTNDMTKQLVDFANVEQNIGTNSRLDKLLKLQNASTNSTNLAYLGRTVTFEGDSFDYTQGMTAAPLAYELEKSAKSVRVDILDSKNRVVRSMTGETTAGTKHVVNWDFKDDGGNAVQPGQYRLNIAPASEKKDDIIKATPFTFGTVNGIGSNKEGETVVSVGTVEVPLSKLTKVY